MYHEAADFCVGVFPGEEERFCGWDDLGQDDLISELQILE
jgi:hypothetical protein